MLDTLLTVCTNSIPTNQISAPRTFSLACHDHRKLARKTKAKSSSSGLWWQHI